MILCSSNSISGGQGVLAPDWVCGPPGTQNGNILGHVMSSPLYLHLRLRPGNPCCLKGLGQWFSLGVILSTPHPGGHWVMFGDISGYQVWRCS